MTLRNPKVGSDEGEWESSGALFVAVSCAFGNKFLQGGYISVLLEVTSLHLPPPRRQVGDPLGCLLIPGGVEETAKKEEKRALIGVGKNRPSGGEDKVQGSPSSG